MMDRDFILYSKQSIVLLPISNKDGFQGVHQCLRDFCCKIIKTSVLYLGRKLNLNLQIYNAKLISALKISQDCEIDWEKSKNSGDRAPLVFYFSYRDNSTVRGRYIRIGLPVDKFRQMKQACKDLYESSSQRLINLVKFMNTSMR